MGFFFELTTILNTENTEFISSSNLNSRETVLDRFSPFSSNNINSAESEERIVFSEMEKILHVEIINVIRSLI